MDLAEGIPPVDLVAVTPAAAGALADDQAAALVAHQALRTIITPHPHA